MKPAKAQKTSSKAQLRVRGKCTTLKPSACFEAEKPLTGHTGGIIDNPGGKNNAFPTCYFSTPNVALSSGQMEGGQRVLNFSAPDHM